MDLNQSYDQELILWSEIELSELVNVGTFGAELTSATG